MEQEAATFQAESVNDLLREGIAAAKAGQRERARDLLTRVVDQDERNGSAWLWLSGVVESLDEREVCLENVLTLDPANAPARKGLDWVRKQKELQPLPPAAETALPPVVTPESPVMARAATPVSPAAAILRGNSDRRQPPPEPQLPPVASSFAVAVAEAPEAPSTLFSDAFDDETLCPYCAAQTGLEDRRCKACGGDLWVRFRAREQRSVLLWILIAFQFFSTLQFGAAPLVVLLFVALMVKALDFQALLNLYLGLPTTLPPETAQAALALVPRFVFLLSAVPFVFSLAVLIGLYLRWRPVYYLFLVEAVLELFFAVASLILFQSTVFGIAGVALALVRVVLIFQLGEDFEWQKRRVLLRLDRGPGNAMVFMVRADEYARRKMWAMAIVHLRRAAAFQPDNLNCRASLAAMYMRIKRYDLAAKALEEIKRADPADPGAGKLAALLDELRAVGSPP